MPETSLHPLAAEYLARVEAAAKRLPRRERDELVEAIEEHLTIAQDTEVVSDAQMLNVLDDLGDPEEVVAAAAPQTSSGRTGVHDIAAILLLLAGAFVLPGVGWLVGVVLLWSSPSWTRGQKWLGTLVVPGGLAAPLLLTWFGPLVHRCEAVADSMPPPPAFAPPISPDGLPQGGTAVDTGSQTMCAGEPLMSTWPGIALAILLVAAALAVGVHLLRAANRSPSQ